MMAFRLKWTASVITLWLAFVNVTDCGLSHTKCSEASTSANEETIERDPHKRILMFKRGQFERIQWLTEQQGNLSQDYSVSTAAAISREIKCNDSYYTLSYLHMTDPKKYNDPEQVFRIHKDINREYSEWAMKMLATSFNVAQNDTDMDVPWLMYLYIKWIEERTAKDTNREYLRYIQPAHDGMIRAVENTMNQNECTMFYPAKPTVPTYERKFSEYEKDKKFWSPSYNFSANYAAVSALLGKHWTDLVWNAGLCSYQAFLDTLSSGPVPGVQPVTEANLTLRNLYLNEEFVEVRPPSAGTTLLRQSSALADGDKFDNFLKRLFNDIKNNRTSFREYVETLARIHIHVPIILDTMLLRIFYNFLENLKSLLVPQWKAQVDKFFIPFNEWCVFLHVPKDNRFYQMLKKDVKHLIMTERNGDYYWYFSSGNSRIAELQQLVIRKLLENKNLGHVHTENHMVQRLVNIDFDRVWLIGTAQEHNISFDSILNSPENHPTNKALLCAKVLIGYIKFLLNGVHLKAVQSLAKIYSSRRLKEFSTYSQN